MLRRTVFNRVTPKGTQYPTFFPGKDDRMGRFSVDAVAEELDKPSDYVRSLTQPKSFSYSLKQRLEYPAKYGRTSRPGGDLSQKKKMFPLFERKPSADKFRRLNPKNYMTF
eukprot:Tbor_TRINITY_DN4153_c0_g1::TRINITY_DN4153_c0_g1_i1::g.26454::m.26454